jgi:hypothetical protein
MHRGQHPQRGIKGRHRLPTGRVRGLEHGRVDDGAIDPGIRGARPQRVDEHLRPRPRPPRVRRHGHGVDEELIGERAGAQPSPPGRGIHDLDDGPMAPPGDDKVEQSSGLADDHDAGQHRGGGGEHVIDGQ